MVAGGEAEARYPACSRVSTCYTVEEAHIQEENDMHEEVQVEALKGRRCRTWPTQRDARGTSQ